MSLPFPSKSHDCEDVPVLKFLRGSAGSAKVTSNSLLLWVIEIHRLSENLLVLSLWKQQSDGGNQAMQSPSDCIPMC